MTKIPLYLFYACLMFHLPALAIAWNRSNRKPMEFSMLTLSATLLWSSSIHSVKLVLLGDDYSHRLFTTIEVNILVAIVLGLYLGIQRRWIAATAAVMLAVGWLFVGAINSTV